MAFQPRRERLLLRLKRNQGSHLRCSYPGCQVVSGSGWEQAVVVGGLIDSGNVVEVSICIGVIQQVEKRVGVTHPVVPQAVMVRDDRRP